MKYRVSLHYYVTGTCDATVVVDAASEEEAFKLVREMSDRNEVEYDDPSDMEGDGKYYLDSVEPVELPPS